MIQPKENKNIFAKMEKRGAIISGFAMGTFPGPQNFPIRNLVTSWEDVIEELPTPIRAELVPAETATAISERRLWNKRWNRMNGFCTIS